MDPDVEFNKKVICNCIMTERNFSWDLECYSKELTDIFGKAPVHVAWLKKEEEVKKIQAGAEMYLASRKTKQIPEESMEEKPWKVTGSLLVHFEGEIPYRNRFTLLGTPGYRLAPWKFSFKGEPKQCNDCFSFLHETSECKSGNKLCSTYPNLCSSRSPFSKSRLYG